MRTSTRVDFAHIQRVVPLTSILARYGALEKMKRSNQKLRGPCPLCTAGAKRCFIVDEQSNRWTCFAPEHTSLQTTVGGVIDYVSIAEKRSIRDAAALIADWFSIRPLDTHAPEKGSPPMSDKLPTHRIFVVEPAQEGSDKNAFWHRVGSGWTFSTDKASGINVVITPGISVSGRLTILEYTEEDRERERKQREQNDDDNRKRKR